MKQESPPAGNRKRRTDQQHNLSKHNCSSQDGVPLSPHPRLDGVHPLPIGTEIRVNPPPPPDRDWMGVPPCLGLGPGPGRGNPNPPLNRHTPVKT